MAATRTNPVRKGKRAQELTPAGDPSQVRNAAMRNSHSLARARVILSEPIDYMYHSSFDATSAAVTILSEPPTPTVRKDSPRAPAGLPSYLASLYEVPLLNAQEETYYFRKMNYLKHKAAQLRETLSPNRPSARKVEAIDLLLRQAQEVKNLLVRTNLRLVVAVARQCARPTTDFFEVVSDGNISLMRAVEKFDFSRGFKFSTYATWAIKRNFARSIPAEYNRLGRFRTGLDELFQNSKDQRGSQFAEERLNRGQHEALTKLMNQLQDRERDIIALRYGLADELEPLTLEQVGRHFGVSKERIRQLEARALRKLREIATAEKLDVLGV